MVSYRSVFLFFLLIFLPIIHLSARSDIVTNNEKSEVYIKVPIKNAEDITKLSSLGLAIEASLVKNKIAEGFITKNRIADLMAAGFNVTIDEQLNADWDQNPEMQSFYSFEDCRKQLVKWATEYSELGNLDTIGFSIKKRPIWILTITGTPDTHPKMRVHANGATHGNENIGTEIVMWMAKDLLTKYATDQKIKELVDRTEFVIHPIVNPDGFIRRRRNLENGDDGNRCGGVMVGSKGNSEPYEHPELKAYRDVQIQAPTHLNIDYHCGTIAMLIAFFVSKVSLNLDNAEYDKVKQLYPPSYEVREPDYFDLLYAFNAGITNSAPAAKYGTISLMPEVCRHNPSASQIEKIATHNYTCIKAVLDDMQKGIRGVVTDAQTNAPVYARISVKGKFAPTYSHQKSGGYFKYICKPTGTYEVTAYANGYKKETKSVTANANGYVECNFILDRLPAQNYAVMSIDAILSYNSSIGQDALLNCLELNDGKSMEIVGKSSSRGFVNFDFGPNHFAYNVDGDDITVYATGNYKVSAGYHADDVNKPGNLLGQGSGKQSFDLGKANIDSARFIQISTSGTVALDAVEAKPSSVTNIDNEYLANTLANKMRITSILKDNKGVTITTFIPKGKYVITIYNSKGIKVADVSKGYMTRNGIHSFSWNRTGNHNTLRASGMYLFTISSGGITKTIPRTLRW